MSLLLEALKRAERAKRQQAEAADTPKLEAAMTAPAADTTPPVAQEKPTLATGAPYLELDLSGLEAFEATLTSNQATPTLAPAPLAEAASAPSLQDDATPLEFSLPQAELAPLPGDNSLDFPAIEWSLPEEKSAAQDANTAPIDATDKLEGPLPPEKGDAITLAPLPQEETAPLTISEPQPLPERSPGTPAEEAASKESAPATAAPSLEPVAASSTEKTAQPAEHSENKSLGGSLEEARNKARRLLGKPAPAVPEAPPPSRFSRRQLTLLSLLLAATMIGAAGTYYAWLQMTPAPLLTTSGSTTPAAPPVADGNTAANAPAVTQEPAPDPAPALPQAQESAPAPTKELADHAAKALAQRPPQPPVADTAPAPASASAAAAGPISIVRNPPRIDVLDESVRQGFAAYDRGDYHNARMQYQKASKADPRNRQAILGLAATEEAAGNSSAAASLYAQALALDPRDPVAQAALLNLTTADPSQGESKLRLLLTEQPDRSFLHFALGNVLAAQLRWPEAEQAYFRASTLDSNNPDFAFNLAISLDQLHQRQPAREHYQRALELASKRPARFDRQSARLRLEQLSARP